MTSTCGLRIAARTRSVSWRARLAPPDVERGDDEVEPGEELVLVVEPAVGPDLELAAVEEAEALRGVAGGAVPAASSRRTAR